MQPIYSTAVPLFFITVPENPYKLIYCIPNEISNSVDKSRNLNFPKFPQDFQSVCIIFFLWRVRQTSKIMTFLPFSNSFYHFLTYCTLIASFPFISIRIFMGEIFAASKNQIPLRTTSLDQVSDVAIAHQFIP